MRFNAMELTDLEVELWVHNDPVLYDWWQATGLELNSFIELKRDKLLRYIQAVAK